MTSDRTAVQSQPIPNTFTMTGYVYDAEGKRVAKGTILAMSCDPSVNGFQATNDYVRGPGGEQLTETGSDGQGNMVWTHSNVYADGRLIATYNPDGLHFCYRYSKNLQIRRLKNPQLVRSHVLLPSSVVNSSPLGPST